MTTIGAATVLIAFGLIAARVARRAFLRYRGHQHIDELIHYAAGPAIAERRR